MIPEPTAQRSASCGRRAARKWRSPASSAYRGPRSAGCWMADGSRGGSTRAGCCGCWSCGTRSCRSIRAGPTSAGVALPRAGASALRRLPGPNARGLRPLVFLPMALRTSASVPAPSPASVRPRGSRRCGAAPERAEQGVVLSLGVSDRRQGCRSSVACQASGRASRLRQPRRAPIDKQAWAGGGVGPTPNDFGL